MSIITYFSVSVTLIALIAYYAVPGRQQWKVLLGASIVYFALCSPIGTAAMVFCSLFSYFAAKEIAKSSKTGARRCLLVSSVLLYLAAWVIVKEFSGAFGNHVFLFSTLRISETATTLGVSYFLLRFISYTADVYTRKCEPEGCFFRLLLFYIYFPAVLEGPIERYGSFGEKLFPVSKTKISYENIRQAGILILQGFFKLFVVSRFCAQFTQYMNDPEGKNALFLIFIAILYSFQIYADFSGGIDIIRGLSFLFGIGLSENFRLPYLSQSFSEFWKRWHITFSAWLKDYIYIPLGGSRKGKARIYLNLLIVFAVSGLWHGFGLTFFIWGLLQAIYQIVERLFRSDKDRERGEKKPNLVIYLLKSLKVFLLSTFTWVFFNAESLSHVGRYFSAVFASFKKVSSVGIGGLIHAANADLYKYSPMIRKAFFFYVFLIAAMTIYSIIKDRTGFDITDPEKTKVGIRWTYYTVILILVLVFGYYGDTFTLQSFIYGAF